MAKIKAYVISCSSDGDVDVRRLFVWGDGDARSLPMRRAEAERRIIICRKNMQCHVCDAEIHEICIKRTLSTKGGWRMDGKKKDYYQKYYQKRKKAKEEQIIST